MTYEGKKAYLEGYIRCMRRIEALSFEYEKWEAIGTKSNQGYSPAPGGGNNSSKTETGGMNMADIMLQIEEERKATKKLRDEIQKAIRTKSAKRRYAELLEYRYINGLPNGKIAELIEKDKRSVERAIKAAINGLQI